MIRALFALILVSAWPTLAAAKPVSTQQAIKELRDRGATVGETVLIFGEPMITAVHEDQGYRLVLSQCESVGNACQVVVFSACQRAKPLTASELISFANEQNRQPTARGTIYADRDGGLGDVICVRHRRDLHKEDVFDMTDVFTWHTILRDFTASVEEAKRDAQVRDLLGIDDAPGASGASGAFAPAPRR